MMQPDSEPGQQVRKHDTRSRDGCHTCKKRHVRCDGNKPACTRCSKAEMSCDFRAPELRLRERRAILLSGEQQPWTMSPNHPRPVQLNRALDMNLADPFGCLPVQMLFNSRQLLYYFHHLRDSFICPRGKEMDILPFIVQNSDALQDTLLVAGLHYVLTTGDVRTYKSTILYHKIETIQLINKGLENLHTTGLTTLIRRIATLCLIEFSLGNMATAETHFQGLLTLVHTYHLEDSKLDTQMKLEEELTYRYLVLTYNVVHAVRSRMQESDLISKISGWSRPKSLEEHVALLFSWYSQHSLDVEYLKLQLKAIAMLPFFFAALPPTAKFHDLDGSPLIECIRSLTKSTESVHFSQKTSEPRWTWMEGSASRLNFAIVNCHAVSLFGVTENVVSECSSAEKGLGTSWCSIAITSGLYLHSVLGLWNAGKPIECRLFRLLMVILVRDLSRNRAESNDRSTSDLWFWEHFIGGYSLAWHQSHAYDETLQAFESYFDSSMRTWSQASNVTRWEEAQQRLLNITWSLSRPQILARKVWGNVLGKHQRARKPKVRTGCATCKARHVKCDERKPTCLRCETARIPCDGYPNVPVRKKEKPARPTTSLIPIRPRP
ncbi:hypothetical protein B0T10DRAFT_497333 [Thelonectria olida]|uniref:Zn(2)-C6 fungal-type domain-containing protein n=1 Tax=Thelonectria olida TaxID=1576542 RepID=A0A9P8VW47_9HYPO|nr:hypothetical protein B0T10DRAFT_497333 [Thelonectria olida]